MNRIDPRQRLPAEPRIVALGGGGGGVGRSTIATELARLAARKGRRTLVVDADVANPSAHRRFELSADHLEAGAFVEAAPVAPLIIGGDRQRPAVLPLGPGRVDIVQNALRYAGAEAGRGRGRGESAGNQ